MTTNHQFYLPSTDDSHKEKHKPNEHLYNFNARQSEAIIWGIKRVVMLEARLLSGSNTGGHTLLGTQVSVSKFLTRLSSMCFSTMAGTKRLGLRGHVRKLTWLQSLR